jgi:ferredoxin
MIITKSKDINFILNQINDDNCFIMGCSECATICKTGGENEVNTLVKKLNDKGIEIKGSIILDPACHKLNNIRLLKKYKKELEESKKIIVLSCGNGAQTVSEIFEDKDVICGTETLFLGEIKHLNEFEKRCNQCGECIIYKFENLCPITRCPKNILNGPCGGSINGKCEIDPDMDCIWYNIFNKFNSKNKTNELKNIIKPFNWSSYNKWRVKL